MSRIGATGGIADRPGRQFLFMSWMISSAETPSADVISMRVFALGLLRPDSIREMVSLRMPVISARSLWETPFALIALLSAMERARSPRLSSPYWGLAAFVQVTGHLSSLLVSHMIPSSL